MEGISEQSLIKVSYLCRMIGISRLVEEGNQRNGNRTEDEGSDEGLETGRYLVGSVVGV